MNRHVPKEKLVPSYRLREQTERANAAEQKLAELQAQMGDADFATLLRNVRRNVARGKILMFEEECFRLGDLVADKVGLSPARAADILLTVATDNDLVRVFGADWIQTLISEGLAE